MLVSMTTLEYLSRVTSSTRSHTQGVTLNDSHLRSHTQRATLSESHSTSHTQRVALNESHSTSRTQRVTLYESHSTSHTLRFTLESEDIIRFSYGTQQKAQDGTLPLLYKTTVSRILASRAWQLDGSAVGSPRRHVRRLFYVIRSIDGARMIKS